MTSSPARATIRSIERSMKIADVMNTIVAIARSRES
jgi:hypothetical protein